MAWLLNKSAPSQIPVAHIKVVARSFEDLGINFGPAWVKPTRKTEWLRIGIQMYTGTFTDTLGITVQSSHSPRETEVLDHLCTSFWGSSMLKAVDIMLVL